MDQEAAHDSLIATEDPARREWRRRALITAGVVALAHALRFVPAPGVALREWGTSTTANGWFIVSRDFSVLSVGALGAAPMASAFGIVAIVFELVPRLRRSLDNPGGEQRLMQSALWITICLAVIQGTAMALFQRAASHELGFPEYNPWLYGGTLTAFAALYGALPFALQRWGLGWGASAAVLFYCLLTVAIAVHGLAFDWLVADHAIVRPLEPAAIVGVVLATCVAVRRWMGVSELLPGEPRLERVGTGVGTALFAFMLLNALVLSRIALFRAIGAIGMQAIELGFAVGGGFWLATQRTSGRERETAIAPRQWVAAGTFVVLITVIAAFVTNRRFNFPWAECVVATIILCRSWYQVA